MPFSASSSVFSDISQWRKNQRFGGIRRSRHERDKLNDHAVEQANRKLSDLTRRYEEIPRLGDTPDRLYQVPPTPPARLEYRGLPLDAIEDLVPVSPAWRQAQRVTHASRHAFAGRPLTPLHKGHVGPIRDVVNFSCKPLKKRLLFMWRHSIVKMFYRMHSLFSPLAPVQ